MAAARAVGTWAKELGMKWSQVAISAGEIGPGQDEK